MASVPHSRFAHHAWLGWWERVPEDEPLVLVDRRQVAHCLMYLATGVVNARCVSRGSEQRYRAGAGTVRFDPIDGERRIFIGQHNPAYDHFTLVIPPGEPEAIVRSEGVGSCATLRHLIAAADAELQWCIRRLALPAPPAKGPGAHHDEAARRLILRLHRLSGGPAPDWECDGSGFDRVELRNLVDHIDAHLRVAPGLADMGRLTALSPSHFARKFRRATGCSLQRFVNRRRIQASFRLLQDDALPLAQVACELGLSSQSHFTRLFSGLTGMTPAKFRKHVQRPASGRSRRPSGAVKKKKRGGG